MLLEWWTSLASAGSASFCFPCSFSVSLFVDCVSPWVFPPTLVRCLTFMTCRSQLWFVRDNSSIVISTFSTAALSASSAGAVQWRVPAPRTANWDWLKLCLAFGPDGTVSQFCKDHTNNGLLSPTKSACGVVTLFSSSFSGSLRVAARSSQRTQKCPQNRAHWNLPLALCV